MYEIGISITVCYHLILLLVKNGSQHWLQEERAEEVNLPPRCLVRSVSWRGDKNETEFRSLLML